MYSRRECTIELSESAHINVLSTAQSVYVNMQVMRSALYSLNMCISM